MKSIRLLLSAILITAVSASAGTVVQFGGGASNISNANWQVQIGADEIIQWNGANSWGGSFGANGTVSGQGVDSTLYSSNSAVTLTSVAISSSDPAGTNTVSTGNPNVLGVKGGGGDAVFNVGSSEAWTLDFDANVLLKQLIVAGLDFNGETVQIVIDGSTNSFNRTDSSCSNTTWVAGAREVYTFPTPVFVAAGKDIEIAVTAGNWNLQGIVVEVADYVYAQDFDGSLTELVNVKPTDGKIRFGGNNTNQPSINSTEWAAKSLANDPPAPGEVSIVDDGSGTNNLIFLNGKAGVATGVAVVLAPEEFAGATSGTARISFDLTFFNKKAADGSDGFLHIYEASGYDLSGATDARIVLDLAGGTGISVLGVDGSAEATLIESLAFSIADTNSTLDLSFAYSDKAVIAVWESQNKSQFKFDNVVITDDGIIPLTGASDVVMFGGAVTVFDQNNDIEVAVNNAFVTQIGAGEIVQWNGVDSDGGSFGASGTLVDQGVGAALTNAANGLILTTTAIASSDSVRTNTVVTSGVQLGINSAGGVGIFQQSADSQWSFDFNKQVNLKQVVFTGLDAALKDRMRVTVNGVDYDLAPADTDETDVWSGAGNTEVYTFVTPVAVLPGAAVTISTHPDQAAVDPGLNKWGLYAVVVDLADLAETLTYVDFGGNPNLLTNAAYQADMGGDAVIAWWGGDDENRFLGSVGTLKDQGIGATLNSVKYELSITSLAIASTNAARTNTVVSGGQLGVNFEGSGNCTFEAADGDTSWTFELDKDVYLAKASFKGLTGGLEKAAIIIDGVTNLISYADCTDASYVTAQIYTFPSPVFISAGTDITVGCPNGKWGLANLLFGLANAGTVDADVYYARWTTDYPGMGVDTALTDNPDFDTLNNLYEYALGGDPASGGDVGILSESQIVNDGGTNYFNYVYYKRSDAAARGLLYEVELTDNLVTSIWTNGGYDVVEGPVDGDFRSVTNRISTVGEPKRFIKLNVEFQ